MISPRSTWLLSAESSRELTVRKSDSDLQLSASRIQLKAHATALAFSPDDRYLAVGNSQNTVEIYDLNAGMNLPLWLRSRDGGDPLI